MASRDRWQRGSRRPWDARAFPGGIVLEPATFQRLRSIAGAVTNLWGALGFTSPAGIAWSEEHAERVALLGLRIARAVGMSEEEALRILRAGFLRDVGSLAVSESILLKPGRLTADERAAMEVHPLVSYELLNALLSTEDLAGIALSHHERYDGNGYPDGLEGKRIPLEARVLAIADSLDAMTSWRPYREALSFPAARKELISQAGCQFDPEIVEVLLRSANSYARHAR
jgi:HD-GYP domain-containing protein (c-di-GMP phosphodiesterase class II)